MNKLIKAIRHEIEDCAVLLRNIPSVVMALFVVSIILMNLLANREIITGVPWLALDCGLLVSWMSFLAMDMLTKRFGPKASVKLSLVAVGINLLVCIILFVVSRVPGNWAAFYDFEMQEVNQALDNTFGGTWYILMGSTIACLVASVVNAVVNSSVGHLCKTDGFGAYMARSYISTLVGQFLDNFVFALIVSHTFFGWTLLQCVTCSLTGCIVELLCEVVFSPIGYRVCKGWDKHHVGKAYLEYAGIHRR